MIARFAFAALLIAAGTPAFAQPKAPTTAAAPVKASSTSSSSSLIDKFNALVLSDVQSAQALAHGAGDAVAESCFAAIGVTVQQLQAVQSSTTGKVAPITAFERVRLVTLTIKAGGPVATACAALQAQIQSDIALMPANAVQAVLGLL